MRSRRQSQDQLTDRAKRPKGPRRGSLTSLAMGRTQAEPEVVESAKRDDLSSLDGSEPAKAAAQGDSPEARADTWLRRHQLILYFALAYAISWPFWLLKPRLMAGIGVV